MARLKKIVTALIATSAASSISQAADVSVSKATEADLSKPVCYVDLMAWIDTKPADCPLGIPQLSVYGAIDMGVSYQTHAAPFNGSFPNGVNWYISKQSTGPGFVPTGGGGWSQSNIGIKANVPLFLDVRFIADLNAGFDPFSLRLSDGPRSLVSQNGIPSIYQQSSGDSSRAGQIGNTRAYAGLSSPTYGTLKVGRVYSFSNELIGQYDPSGGSYAFSLLGTSSTFGGGLGFTEMARYNTAIQYLYEYEKLFHAGVMAQIGGFGMGNGSMGAYQLNVGFSFAGLSVDAVYAYSRNAIALSTFTPVLPAGWTPQSLKATYGNQRAIQLLAKYKYENLTVSGGYQQTLITNPSLGDQYFDATNAVMAQGSGYYVTPYINGSVTTNAYDIAKRLQIAWVGAKYTILPNVDVGGAYWHVWQNNYNVASQTTLNSTACFNGYPYTISGTGGKTWYPAIYGQGTSKSDCSGHADVVSAFVNWKPYKRIDVYAGVMYSYVSAGLASGFVQTNNVALTTGVKYSF